MGSGDLFKHLFKSLNLDKYIPGAGSDARVQLTPLIALIASIIYMMIADGEVSDSESSQLQSVIGDNEEALHRAVRYVEATPIEDFLQELPSVVFGNDKLCILINVCDSIMADGELSSLEWDLFQNILTSLGHSEKSFKPYFGAISIKNKRSVLGSFDGDFSPDTLTPQLSLAVSLLYMMSSDGVMATEEIGQLQVIIGESKSLLKAALKYVGQNKAHQFLKNAPDLLNPRQKLCLLVNTCDTMLSDGLVENAERDLFKRMLPAFGYSEDSFKAYYQILFLKNERPLDRRPVIKKPKNEIPTAIEKGEEESVVFDRKFLVETEKSSNEDFQKVDHSDRVKDGKLSLGKNALENTISGKIRENSENLAKAIQDEQGLATIAENANQINDVPPKDASDSTTGPVINHTLKEDKLESAPNKAKKNKQDGPVLKNALNDGSGPKIKSHLVDAEKGPSISNHITDSDSGLITKNRIDDSDGPVTKNRIDDADGPITKNHINDADGPITKNRIDDSDGPEINRHSTNNGVDISGKHLRDDKANTGKSSIKKSDGPEISRHQHDVDHDGNTDVQAHDGDGPIIRNDISDDSGEAAGTPKKRMVFAKIRTAKIHGCLDQLEKYDVNKPNSKGVDMSSISNAPRPAEVKQQPVAVVPVTAAATTAPSPSPVPSIPPTIIPAANSPKLEKKESAAVADSVPLTSSHHRLIAGVLFTALSAAHGLSSVGESSAQTQMVGHGYQVVQAQSAFQSVSAQQTNYQLTASGLDLSLSDTSALSNEQKDITESRLVLYRSAIQNLESSPLTMNGKKELASSINQQNALAQQASLQMNSFAVAKAILLFGIGLSFMAFFSTSRWVLYGSGLAALLGMGMTANGFLMLI
ncbi:MAG: DUF4337 family protein [bacterium]